LHYVQLLAVAARDVDFDLDGSVDVADGSADAAGETRAALEWCKAFECHCYSGKDSVSWCFDARVYVESLPLTFPVVGAHLEDLQKCRSNVVLCIKPWQRIIWVEWRLPNKATIILQFHLEARVGQ